jgi:hypothetical protein
MAQSTLPTRWRVLHSPPVLPKESRTPLIRICETHRFVGRSRLGSPRGEGEDEGGGRRSRGELLLGGL